MKQTAIEWLVKQVNSDCLNSTFIRQDLIEQAKQMEKEQIMEAFDFGVYDGGGIIKKYEMSGKQYYNETFKSE